MANPVSSSIVALAGNPNCGKTALFNALTGGRAKVGNYPGVTVERKEGTIAFSTISILDLPGTYGLESRTLDEAVTRDVLLGRCQGESIPDLILAVVDANNLERSLAFVLELKALGRPMVLALNMFDLARDRKVDISLEALETELGIPVVATAATRKEGIPALLKKLQSELQSETVRHSTPHHSSGPPSAAAQAPWHHPTPEEIRHRFAEVDRILARVIRHAPQPSIWTDRIDRVVLHPVWGSLLLLFVLGFVFQAIFAWAQVPMDWIKAGVESIGLWLGSQLSEGPLKSLLIDGILAGVGSVVVFLPQILLLFLFILVLEDSGYLPRAAFLMDRLMGKVGLHGRAFIPLLSSFACAIPGIMATRTIENRRDRLITILVAPLTTCSARLPVYSLLIGAFIPHKTFWGGLGLQGLVMLSLYLAGIAAALIMALVFRHTLLKGETPMLLLDLPTYKWPSLMNIGVGLFERGKLFLRRAGTVILSISIVLWFLASYPKPPVSATGPAISYSFAGMIGHWIEPVLRPIGFNWKIAVALIPGFAAREVMIGSLATVYAVEEKAEGMNRVLAERLVEDWSIATGLSLLVWYVLACQCISTLAVTRRETNSILWPAVMLAYMTALAYGGSFITYTLAVRAGLG